MTDSRNPNSSKNLSSSSSFNGNINANFSGQKVHYPNPPDARIRDPATVREQLRFAIKQYRRWYSHAWGTAIVAGLSFFPLGWIVKGANPLPSFKIDDSSSKPSSSPNEDTRSYVSQQK